MDYVILTAITFFVLGFVVAALLFGRAVANAQPAQPVDMSAMMQSQLQALQLQNMMRSAQLEQQRQEAEMLALRQQRDAVARLNHSDIQAAIAQIGTASGGYQV